MNTCGVALHGYEGCGGGWGGMASTKLTGRFCGGYYEREVGWKKVCKVISAFS